MAKENGSSGLKKALDELLERRQNLMTEVEGIDAELMQFRTSLGGIAGATQSRSVRRTATAPREGRKNQHTIKEWCAIIASKADAGGISKEELTTQVLAAGYVTDMEPTAFQGSVYVSGINNLIKENLMERTDAKGQIAFYVLTKEGKKYAASLLKA